MPGVWRGFDYEAMARAIAADTPGLQVLVVDTDADGTGLPDRRPRDAPAARRATRDHRRRPGGWFFYTSGTTSDPKGARHGDIALDHIAGAMAERLDTRDRDRSGIAFPYTHIGGITWLFATLQCGVVLILDEAFDPQRTPRYFAAENVTHVGSGTPFHMAYLATQRSQPDVPLFPQPQELPGRRVTEAARDPLRGEGRARRRRRDLVVGAHRVAHPQLLPHHRLRRAARHHRGHRDAGGRALVVKADGTRRAPGEEGELRAKGPQVMHGYLDASLDAEAFDADGYFRTGDLGTIDDDGYVVITGRLKDVIIRNSENISAKEVEDLLYEHPKVFDVAVIGVPDPRTHERVCAVVALKDPDDPLTMQEMQDFLRGRAIRNQAIPEQLEYIAVMPRNASGKITKNVLREQFGATDEPG